MEYIENDFAQVEHINQVIANNLSHESWDCFDTYELLEQFPSLGIFTKGNRQNSYLNIPNNVKNIFGELVTKHESIRYNSFIVSVERSIVVEEGVNVEYYIYTFEVRNTLWDGIYKITKSYPNTKGEYEEFPEDDIDVDLGVEEGTTTPSSNIIVVSIRGSDKNKVRACFHMNMAGSTRDIKVTTKQLVLTSKDDFKHQYDTTNYEAGSVALTNGKEGSDVTVTIKPCDKAGRLITYDKSKVGAYIPEHTLSKTGKDFKMPYGPTSVPGDYWCRMEAFSSNKNTKSAVQKIIHVKKVQDEKAVVDWGDEKQYKYVYKGSIKKYRIKFNLENEMGGKGNNDKLINVPVNITFISTGGKRITHSSAIKKDSALNEYYAEAVISYRGYYEDHSRLEVELSSEYGFGRIFSQKLIDHHWFVADTYNDILSQLYLTNSNGNYIDKNGNVLDWDSNIKIPNEYGTDWIFLKNKEYKVTGTLYLNRDITITSAISAKGNYARFNGDNKKIIKTVSSDPDSSNLMKINLVGLKFSNAECAIESGAGTRLLVDRCIFTGNHHDKVHHKGCSIYIANTDYSVKHPELWKTEIRNSHFENNKGNEIQSIGTTRIIYNKFITTDSKWLQQPEVKVVNAVSGSVSYQKNISYINTGKTPMKSNHSYAKALAHVSYNATFNGAGPNRLKGDMTLPLYKDYGNQAYTYSIYYYPYSNVKTEIVCSPRSGYERKASGHASSAKNWVYYDGYYFVRWERGRNVGNTKNPWTKAELAMPDTIGIFNEKGEGFIDDYDPRFAKSKCLTSYYDK